MIDGSNKDDLFLVVKLVNNQVGKCFSLGCPEANFAPGLSLLPN
jgi:hypothetical protein